MGEIKIRSEKGRITEKEGGKDRDGKCAALRRSITHQTPAASLFPPPPLPPHHPPPPGERATERRAREREQQRESERVTLTSQQRRDVKRRIYKGEKKSFSLFCCLSSCILLAERSEEERGGSDGHISYAASPRFPWLYHSLWSAGRAAESSIGDIAPQQKKRTVEEPGCLTT